MNQGAPGASIKARLEPYLNAAAEVIIGISGNPKEAVPFDLFRLRTEAAVAEEFRSHARRHLTHIAAHDVIAFDHGHTPDEGEAMELKVADFDYPELIKALLGTAELPKFEPDEDLDVAFYCVRYRTAEGAVGFLRQVSSVLLGKRNLIATLLVGDRVSKLEAQVLTFTPGVDIAVEDGTLWVSNASAFRTLFRGADAVAAAISSQVKKLTASVAIANADDFERACRSDPRMMAKLARVMKQPYLPQLTPKSLRQLVKTYDLPDDLLDAHGKLVHANSPARRWMILRILDDAYVESGVTKLRYAANSKRRL